MNRIEVHQDGGRPEVLIDGQPIACRRVTLRFEVGHLPQVEIEPSVIRGDARLATTLVHLDPVLAALLESFGWAPPKEAESITDGGRVSRPGHEGETG